MPDLAIGDAHLVSVDDRIARDTGSDMVNTFYLCVCVRARVYIYVSACEYTLQSVEKLSKNHSS